MATNDNSGDPLRLLMGQEVSAVCFVRDYVELHFDGPVLRALSHPFGLYGCRGWRFPAQGSLELMRCYIGKTVDDYELDPDRILAVDFGEHRFAIPLDHASRVEPEAAHLIGVDDQGHPDARVMWIWQQGIGSLVSSWRSRPLPYQGGSLTSAAVVCCRAFR